MRASGLAVVVFGMLLVACGDAGEMLPSPPQKGAVVGRWQEGIGVSDPVLVLNDNMAFQAFNWPVAASIVPRADDDEPSASTQQPTDTRVMGEGRWSLLRTGERRQILLRWQRVDGPQDVSAAATVGMLSARGDEIRFANSSDELVLHQDSTAP
ncbi:MAG: hypothetical protein PF961_10280 [Planctomycetota bacterium]|jgi:hypothetical protein|nr:hypothetical protein [Planctomycetota bacterium]